MVEPQNGGVVTQPCPLAYLLQRGKPATQGKPRHVLAHAGCAPHVLQPTLPAGPNDSWRSGGGHGDSWANWAECLTYWEHTQGSKGGALGSTAPTIPRYLPTPTTMSTMTVIPLAQWRLETVPDGVSSSMNVFRGECSGKPSSMPAHHKIRQKLPNIALYSYLLGLG